MNRPDKKNAISVMAREMVEVFDQLETDKRCEVLVLTGVGDAFSAGMDLKDWGIIPAGVVCKAISTVMSQRDAVYYNMTGETFDGNAPRRWGW